MKDATRTTTLKVGDLVKHNPAKSTVEAVQRIYTDWGHKSDFKAGIVVKTKDSFAQVLASDSTLKKPVWYEATELEVLSEAR